MWKACEVVVMSLNLPFVAVQMKPYKKCDVNARQTFELGDRCWTTMSSTS